uniref:WD repeat and HMG-box DNA-binding protein 1-like n=1 Tax=Phallusia mammillata TaxID=59560 RepID=A0A6F9DX15_9ASCI|nr:WD repeat and HMG-box DNA-binding protein 1-like [Phallusia mammillata]
MTSEDLTIRIGHSDGLTDMCYDDSGKYLVSCGFDGSVKIWKGVDDDEPKTLRLGDQVHSVAIKGATLYVGSDNNSVDRYEFPKGEPDGILARFTGTPTCLAVSESKKYVAAGSSDFDLKVMLMETGKQKCFLGHQAPILSVSLDPMDEYLASMSCDGTMKVWNLSNQESVTSISVVKPSNDVGNSESMGKICWRPATGEDIAVPVADGVAIYSRITWQCAQSFKTDVCSTMFQCCAFSLCGRFVAGGTADGWIVVWDAETQECVRTQQSPHKASICSIAWNPQENNSLAFSDVHGQIGVLDNVVLSEQPTKKPSDQNDIDALFDDEDDNMMVDLMAEEDKPKDEVIPSTKKNKHIFDDSDNESESASRKGSQLPDLPPIPSTLDVFGEDNLDLAPPSIPPPGGVSKPLLDDDASSVATAQTGTVLTKAQPSSMQPPFQPGSTPVHLSHRFMVWNSVGIIRCYNDEIEHAIDIEFHDAQTHHPLHLSNNERFTMADLSQHAAVLATESDGDTVSKLKCVHFSSWDNNKQWSVDMPEGEDIQAVTIGDYWIAVCTDAMQVRLFALGGTQRQIFSLPGPVVAMAAHTDQLSIAYHITQGFSTNQCLGFMLLEVGAGSGCKAKKVVGGQPLPISNASTLTWIGFTCEGTPATVDSTGIVRLMNRSFCGTWVNVLNTKQATKSRYDHYWVVGLHQDPQQVRCILCKGLSYPQTLPRPTLTVLQYKMPYCDMENDKGTYEEEYWRTRLMSSFTDYLTSRGYEEDAETKQKYELNAQRTLMKLFALLCKTDQEFEAHEVCGLMPSASSVNLAIKYASRIRKIMLAQRLSEVAQEKAQDEMEAAIRKQKKENQGVDEEDSDEDVEDFRDELRSGYSASETEWTKARSQQAAVTPSQASRFTDRDTDVEVVTSQRSVAEPEQEIKPKPGRSLSSQLAGTRRNPFKKSTSAASSPAIKSQTTPSSAPTSGSVLDNIKRTTPTQQRRGPVISDSGSRKSKGKDSAKTPKSGQSTLFSTKLNLTSTPKPKKQVQRCKKDDNEECDIPTLKEKLNGQRKNSGVQLYIEENLALIQQENPDVDGVDARKIAIQAFRDLTPEDRTVWNDRAKATQPPDVPVAQKRKHVSEEEEYDNSENAPPTNETEGLEKPKLKKIKDSEMDARSKLSAFSYQAQE